MHQLCALIYLIAIFFFCLAFNGLVRLLDRPDGGVRNDTPQEGLKSAGETEKALHMYADGFQHLEFTERGYPIMIPLIQLRKDSRGQPVEKKRLERLGGISKFMASNDGNWLNNGNWELWSNEKATRLEEFRAVLQCSSYEPGLEGRRGLLSFMRLLGVSQRSILLASAWIESQHRKGADDGFAMAGGCSPWVACKKKADGFMSGQLAYPDRLENYFVKMVRVTKGRLYLDWPWGSGRIFKRPDFNVIRLFSAVLEMVKDLPDSVFFIQTYDRPLFPSNFPFPAFSHSPKSDSNSDIPFPWPRIINDEVQVYTDQIMGSKRVYPDLDPHIDKIWASRAEKAGFFGQLWEKNPAALARQVLVDISFSRPDLIDARFTGANPMNPYNPASDEHLFDMKIPRRSKRHLPDDQHGIENLNATHIPGFIRTLRNKFQKIQSKKDKYIKKYKYLVVLAGNTAADRLATFLAHSGSVILLQETDYVGHFSERIRPWVHYVQIGRAHV